MSDPKGRAVNSGVYEIVNSSNGKRYVGSAVNFAARWKAHRNRLNRGSNASRHLQAAWNKHGEDAFTFRKIIVCAPANLLMYEQLAIDGLRPEYNIRQKAESNIGIKFSAEARARLVSARVGNPNIRGHACSDETRAKISAANSGKKASAETREKLSTARRGKPHPISAEARERVVAAAKGRNTDYMRTPEFRAAMSASTRGQSRSKGRKHSEETRAKMSASYTVLPRFSGKTHTEESRAKMSAKVRAANARRLKAD